MAERCLTLGCPEVIRLSLQEPCTGEPIPGESNGAAISCIRNWSIEPIVREGEASEFVADCGNMVIRDRQDDQLLGYTISFETSTRSNELEALVTGKELIESGGLNIGTYGVGSNLGCTSPSADPRLMVEAFYKLSRCVEGATHVRVVIPMAQFKVTELDREGSITFYRFTAETSITLANAIGSGPFGDFPADVVTFLAARDADEYTTGLDFEEVITITGSCGTIEVPGPEGFVTEEDSNSSNGVFIDSDSEGRYLTLSTDPTPGPNQLVISRFLEDAGETQPDQTWGTAGRVTIVTGTSDVELAIAVDKTTDEVFVSAIFDLGGTPFVGVAKLTALGVLDATWGTAGIANLGPGASGVRTVLHVDSAGEVVVAGPGQGELQRLDVTGAIVETATLTAPNIRGMVAHPSVAQSYWLSLVDGFNDVFTALVDMSDGTFSEVATGISLTDFDLQGSNGITYNESEDRVYLTGTNGAGDSITVLSVNGTTQAVDAAYGVAGVATINDPDWTVAKGIDIHVVNADETLVSANSEDIGTLGKRWTNVRLDVDGALVPTYGVAGIKELTLISTPANDTMYQSLMEEVDGRIVHSGEAYDGVNNVLTVARTLLADGELDITFG